MFHLWPRIWLCVLGLCKNNRTWFVRCFNLQRYPIWLIESHTQWTHAQASYRTRWASSGCPLWLHAACTALLHQYFASSTRPQSQLAINPIRNLPQPRTRHLLLRQLLPHIMVMTQWVMNRTLTIKATAMKMTKRVGQVVLPERYSLRCLTNYLLLLTARETCRGAGMCITRGSTGGADRDDDNKLHF